jgi:glyoxylase-like metal-dependent hydrolase (beta-lactamase superfamily II)
MRLAPNLHRLGTSSLINSYVIDEGGELTIIDTGLRGHWTELQQELAAMGRSLADIRAVLLTHGDVDHVGYAERLRRVTGVPIFVGAADAAEARGEMKKPAAVTGPMRIGPLVQFAVYGFRHGGMGTTPIAEVMPIEGAVTLDVPGSPRVIPLPGHTPGSVAYHVPLVDAVFMGDAMTTRSVTTGITGPALGPFTVDPAMAVTSLGALDGLEAALVLPGHGDAWTGGLPRALELIRQGVARRAA